MRSCHHHVDDPAHGIAVQLTLAITWPQGFLGEE